jgi:hypothetical protein
VGKKDRILDFVRNNGVSSPNFTHYLSGKYQYKIPHTYGFPFDRHRNNIKVPGLGTVYTSTQ